MVAVVHRWSPNTMMPHVAITLAAAIRASTYGLAVAPKGIWDRSVGCGTREPAMVRVRRRA
jgi:hypothetical protein